MDVRHKKKMLDIKTQQKLPKPDESLVKEDLLGLFMDNSRRGLVAAARATVKTGLAVDLGVFFMLVLLRGHFF